jgi:hypothetical protein
MIESIVARLGNRPSSAWVELVPAKRLAQELRCIGEFELFADARAEGLDGLDADFQLFADRARIEPGPEKLEDFELPIAQLRDARPAGGVRPTPNLSANSFAIESLTAILPRNTL